MSARQGSKEAKRKKHCTDVSAQTECHTNIYNYNKSVCVCVFKILCVFWPGLKSQIIMRVAMDITRFSFEGPILKITEKG